MSSPTHSAASASGRRRAKNRWQHVTSDDKPTIKVKDSEFTKKTDSPRFEGLYTSKSPSVLRNGISLLAEREFHVRDTKLISRATTEELSKNLNRELSLIAEKQSETASLNSCNPLIIDTESSDSDVDDDCIDKFLLQMSVDERNHLQNLYILRRMKDDSIRRLKKDVKPRKIISETETVSEHQEIDHFRSAQRIAGGSPIIAARVLRNNRNDRIDDFNNQRSLINSQMQECKKY